MDEKDIQKIIQGVTEQVIKMKESNSKTTSELVKSWIDESNRRHKEFVVELKEHKTSDNTRFKEVTQSIKDLSKKIEGYTNALNALSTGKKMLLGTALLLGSITGIGASIIAISKWFK